MLNNKPLVGFVGQGWIGKNYADNFESRGFEVVRYSLDEPFKNNKDKIKDCDVVFIAVPTPTTPAGFDVSIVKESLSLVGLGKIAVIKSTILPGTTMELQKEFESIVVVYSPEFLQEVSAAKDAAEPFANIVGLPVVDEKYASAALLIHQILPTAPFTSTISSTEAEIIKYSHNASGYTQIILFNLMYDLATKLGANWDNIQAALLADPLISNFYSKPVHKGGRGAGGGCFIKDLAAIRGLYEKVVGDKTGLGVFQSMEKKNLELLKSTNKSQDLVRGVYGDI